MLSPGITGDEGHFSVMGRYALFDEVGHGGMATVHIGRLVGPIGFSKTVAIKRMHANVAKDAELAAMFLDEARIAGRVQHPNVVAAIDVMSIGGDAFLVMEYVHGESLAVLCRAVRTRGERVPPAIAVHIFRDVLHGLHAAHEANGESGEPLDLVHRDVSPQNILVGVDGIARVADFGIAKAVGRLQDTHTGQIKGKIAYMAPEQLLGHPIDRKVDIFAAGVVLWEAIAGRRLFTAESSGHAVYRVLTDDIPSLRSLVPDISESLDAAVAKATARDPAHRFPTALDFARELEQATQLITPRVVGDWVRDVGGAQLLERYQRLRAIEAIPLAAGSPGRTRVRNVSSRKERRAGPQEVTQPEQTTDQPSSRPPSRIRIAAAVGAALVAAVAFLGARSMPPPVIEARQPVPAPEERVGPEVSGPDAGGTSSNDPPGSAETAADQISTSKSVPDPSPRRVPPRVKKVVPKPPPTPTPRRPEDLFSRE